MSFSLGVNHDLVKVDVTWYNYPIVFMLRGLIKGRVYPIPKRLEVASSGRIGQSNTEGIFEHVLLG